MFNFLQTYLTEVNCVKINYLDFIYCLSQHHHLMVWTCFSLHPTIRDGNLSQHWFLSVSIVIQRKQLAVSVILKNACCKTTFFLPDYILLNVPEIEWERAHRDQGKVFSSLLIFWGYFSLLSQSMCTS